MKAGWAGGAGWAMGAGCITESGWATGAGCSVCDACKCEAWACFGGTTRVVVVVSWTSPRMATEVATAVVPVAETVVVVPFHLLSHLASWTAVVPFLGY
ncbi:hypothetical protein ACFX1X_030638 [Malus domestica]